MRTRNIVYRPCRRKDLLPAVRLVLSTLDDILVHTGKKPMRQRVPEAPLFFHHLWRTDRRTFYCAWRGKRMVGFGAAINRGRHWYLAWLFVHPRYQGRGIGRRLLERIWREERGVVHSLATMTYNQQAVGLYSRFGLVPEALLTLMHVSRSSLIIPPPTKLEVVRDIRPADLAWINRLEKEIRGFPHREEWNHWHRDCEFHRILVFRSRSRRVGYGMLTRRGHLFPIGVARRSAMRAVLAESLRFAAASHPEGSEAGFTIACPSENREAYRFLHASGFRNEQMLLLMSDAPIGDLRRYIPANLAVF